MGMRVMMRLYVYGVASIFDTQVCTIIGMGLNLKLVIITQAAA